MRQYRQISLILIALLLVPYLAWAGPAAPGPAVLKIRSHQTAEQMRIVLDMNAPADYKATVLEDPLRIVLELPATVNKTGLPQVLFNHPMVAAVRMQTSNPSVLQVMIELKQPVMHKVFTLANPNRIVVDIFSFFEQKVVTEIMPGLTYTSWLRGQPTGPVWAHILEIDPRAGFALQPVLSNGLVNGLETVSDMAQASRAVAAVNGSFFAANGEIIGLMKMNGQMISTPEVPRTALGVLPDNRVLIDQVGYQGYVELPNGSRVTIDGINRQRGENELILYNGYYNGTTGTNGFGTEYAVKDGKITATGTGNSVLFSDTVVLSAHGKAKQELASLKPGDSIKISHSLGTEWDKTIHAIGAGPMLIKNSSVFLTTKIEEFGSDVSGGRAPRTAMGVTKEGKLLLVVIDGRQVYSAGMTLLELALFMQEAGAVDAMNFDGGGSSEMVVNDKVVNKPSDGKERKVGNALAVISARLAN